MGRAARIAQAKIKERDELISAEMREHPHLWTKPYVITLKRKNCDTLKRIGIEWETISFSDSDLDSICASAEQWKTGAGKIVRERLMMKGKA